MVVPVTEPSGTPSRPIWYDAMVPLPASDEAVHWRSTDAAEVAVAVTTPGADGVATLLEVPAVEVWGGLPLSVAVIR